MTFDVSAGGALLAGLLSFTSPCVLALVPPYLAFTGGGSRRSAAPSLVATAAGYGWQHSVTVLHFRGVRRGSSPLR